MDTVLAHSCTSRSNVTFCLQISISFQQKQSVIKLTLMPCLKATGLEKSDSKPQCPKYQHYTKQNKTVTFQIADEIRKNFNTQKYRLSKNRLRQEKIDVQKIKRKFLKRKLNVTHIKHLRVFPAGSVVKSSLPEWRRHPGFSPWAGRSTRCGATKAWRHNWSRGSRARKLKLLKPACPEPALPQQEKPRQ